MESLPEIRSPPAARAARQPDPCHGTALASRRTHRQSRDRAGCSDALHRVASAGSVARLSRNRQPRVRPRRQPEAATEATTIHIRRGRRSRAPLLRFVLLQPDRQSPGGTPQVPYERAPPSERRRDRFLPFPRLTNPTPDRNSFRSEEHTSELQSRLHLVCRLLLEKKNNNTSLDLHFS